MKYETRAALNKTCELERRAPGENKRLGRENIHRNCEVNGLIRRAELGETREIKKDKSNPKCDQVMSCTMALGVRAHEFPDLLLAVNAMLARGLKRELMRCVTHRTPTPRRSRDGLS